MKRIGWTLLVLANVALGCGGSDTVAGSSPSTTTAAGAGGATGSGGTGTGGHGTGGHATGGHGTGGHGTGGQATGGGGTGGGGPCGAGTKECGPICQSVDDPAFGCASPACAPCSLANADPVCQSGECDIGACVAGASNCDGQASNGCETLTDSDPFACGACGAACVVPHAKPGCAAGSCTVDACDAGYVDCNKDPVDGCEANLQADPANCGACGAACKPNQSCTNGACGMECPVGLADCNGDPGDGCERTLGTASDCAFCGDACSPANGAGSCAAGVCSLATCNAGFGDCDNNAANGCETNLDTSANDCGACGTICAAGEHSTATCQVGACSLACDGGFGDCDKQGANGCETPTSGDASNCGLCGNVCQVANATPGCAAGSCIIASCNPGFSDCKELVKDGCETATQTDPGNCGGCSLVCPIPPNTAPTCAGGACGFTCLAGFANCNGKAADGCEVNVGIDPANCGSCGLLCNLANATSACAGAVCTVAACSNGYGDCNKDPKDGCETNTQADPKNCAGCGQACALANATASCAVGACGVGSCNAGFGDCDKNAANGCEVTLASDAVNCGACGAGCNVPNATPACKAGACAVGACSAGYADCDGNAANGCETWTNGDMQNCGGCGKVCSVPNGSPSCTGGACTVANCNAPQADCDGNAGNGCETNLATSLTSCGACGSACSVANGTPACANGACAVASCNQGFADCDGNYANGCETDLATSTTNCGACGAACFVPNGAPACQAGQCAVASCAVGFADCDKQAGNGCEAYLNADPANCGACGSVCSYPNGISVCNAAACGLAGCVAGFGDCNNQPGDGCEVDLLTTVNNCGACGTVCAVAHGTAACGAGACIVGSCTAPWADCDGLYATGCEANTTSNALHCGACGRGCSRNGTAAVSCAAGLCNSRCDLGFANCIVPASPNPDDGCETSASANDKSCGSCANDCTTMGAPANPLVCDGGGRPKSTCGCSSSASCNLPGANGTCNQATGRCFCDVSQCAAGEVCLNPGNGDRCSCNGGFSCAAGLTCCGTPNGCLNLNTSTANCGACGHACPAGFFCGAGACFCNQNAQCNGGAAGTCNAVGLCVCKGSTCAIGERCLPDGTCG